MEARFERKLCLLIAIITLFYHASTAVICTYLPTDPLYISTSVSGYAWYGCILSLLGLVGIIQRRSSLVTIFSNHLLIDTVLSILPKLGLFYIFFDMTRNSCPTPWTDWHTEELLRTHPHGLIDRLDFGVTGVPFAESGRKQGQCETALLVAHGLLLGVIVLWTLAQWSLSTSVRRYARVLEWEKHGVVELVDVEKAEF